MLPRKLRAGHRSAAMACVIVALAFAGCDSLLGGSSKNASNAQILVTGDSPVPMMLILSNKFTSIVGTDGNDINLPVVADTFLLPVPINKTYPLGSDERVLVRLQNSDSTSIATIRMRVLLDAKDEVYSQRATMKNASLEYAFHYNN